MVAGGAGGGSGGGGSGANSAEYERRMREKEEEYKKKTDKYGKELQQTRQQLEEAEKAKHALAESKQREEAERARAEEQKRDLKAKLKAMEEKLLIGGQLMDKAARQEMELRNIRLERMERQRQEVELVKELAEREEELGAKEEEFETLQEKYEYTREKYKVLVKKYQKSKTEITDLNQELNDQTKHLTQALRETLKSNNLYKIILDNFVPLDQMHKLKKRAKYNEETDEWELPLVDLSGNRVRKSRGRPLSAAGLRRPQSNYSRTRAKFDSNARYRTENIADLDVDQPEKTTVDYAKAQMQRHIQVRAGSKMDFFRAGAGTSTF